MELKEQLLPVMDIFIFMYNSMLKSKVQESRLIYMAVESQEVHALLIRITFFSLRDSLATIRVGVIGLSTLM